MTLVTQVPLASTIQASTVLHRQSAFAPPAEHVILVSYTPPIFLSDADPPRQSTFAPPAEHVTPSSDPILPDIFSVSGPI